MSFQLQNGYGIGLYNGVRWNEPTLTSFNSLPNRADGSASYQCIEWTQIDSVTSAIVAADELANAKGLKVW